MQDPMVVEKAEAVQALHIPRPQMLTALRVDRGPRSHQEAEAQRGIAALTGLWTCQQLDLLKLLRRHDLINMISHIYN